MPGESVKTLHLVVNRRHPQAAPVAQAATVLKQNGVVACPTDTVYGLAANAFSDEARRQLYRLKGRSYRKPLIIMPPAIHALDCLVELHRDAVRLMEKFWPGPLTLILPATPLGRMIMGGRQDLGIRIPDDPVMLALLQQFAAPLATTSANPSGKPSAKCGAEAVDYFDGTVDCVLDAGTCPGGRESTVIDMIKFPYVVIREGALPSKQLLAVL